VVATAVMELWKGSNLAFSLCPMLTQGRVEALMLCGSPEQKKMYLPKMVSGEWTGTMNLTEPQAGSDLSAVRTRAEPVGDGTYKLYGQKIFITYGEHDLAENIVHLVLARLPGAPEGVKGISLFVVPKFLVNADGSLGARNDVRCVSIEHKLGIHASPTCVLSFGDHGGAVGTLVGEPNRGLEYMFIMMNEARFAVGLEGLALSERAYQKALSYAKERIQGFEVGVKSGPRVPIIRHPDVRRMLMLMKSQTEAMRALAYTVGAAFDLAHHHPDESVRQRSRGFVELMTPVVKGWCTENSVTIASLGVQVHGGMGFIGGAGGRRSTTAMRASPPSTKEPPRSSPTISSAARSPATAASSPGGSSKRCGWRRRNCARSRAKTSACSRAGWAPASMPWKKAWPTSSRPTGPTQKRPMRFRCRCSNSSASSAVAGSSVCRRWWRPSAWPKAGETRRFIAPRSARRASMPTMCSPAPRRWGWTVTEGAAGVLALDEEMF